MKNYKQKYLYLFIAALLSSSSLFAQESVVSAGGSASLGEWIFQNIILLMGAATAFGAITAVLYLNNKLLEIQKSNFLKEQGLAVTEKVEVAEKDPWWKRIYDQSWSLVPMEKEKDILMDHDYDGIRELDNVLPPWWVALFYACIIIGFAYLGYYHVWDIGMSSSEEYAAEMEYAESQVQAFLSRQPDRVDENNVAVITDESKLGLAEALYLANCATCHGQKGEGGIGPNMTDEYWIHGGNINDIFRTIKYGVPAKGMIAWKSQLRPADMQNLASFILTLQGTNPPNGKVPEGEIYQEGNAAGNELGMQ